MIHDRYGMVVCFCGALSFDEYTKLFLIITKRTHLQKRVEILATQCWNIAMSSAAYLGAFITLLLGRAVIYPTSTATHMTTAYNAS